jgi:hypothetical protein
MSIINKYNSKAFVPKKPKDRLEKKRDLRNYGFSRTLDANSIVVQR